MSKVDKKQLEEYLRSNPRQTEDPEFLNGEIDPPPVHSKRDTLYGTARVFVLDSIRRAEQEQPPEVERGITLVSEMLDSLSSSAELVLTATNRRQEFSITSHSVNVAILSLQIAGRLEFAPERLIVLGLAALWHEIGVSKLPPNLMYQTGNLSEAEHKLLKDCPVYSGQILKTYLPRFEALAEIVEQMYERENGSGFPLGLKGREIREEAKVLGVANVFEAFIHDRPHRPALTGYHAILELTGKNSSAFSGKVLKALLKAFSLYPYNEYVVLNSGEIAKVICVHSDNLFRPTVRILYDDRGNPLKENRVVNLKDHPSLYIDEAITTSELSERLPLL